MKNSRKTFIIGHLSKRIIEKWHLDISIDKEIYQSVGLYKHIYKHINEYISNESADYTLKHIKDIIAYPDYVSYNLKQKSIEYYKYLLDPISVVVQQSKDDTLYVASVYPVKEAKIRNRKKKEHQILEQILIDKYKYNEVA